ncbi:hypothetical protein N802_10710 [Knoellia sinensis KCTC 19936]|uniref:Lipoprotein n=1 Tax=Knoellia sinensis KCTC 19936 TaxID=1385520 RepID=A0A0A0J408_9MICO|nr:hypothetical protein [Knoellia sinensis]KGN32065.1 hypothetical protein N802_10710 [Knoellia sinensis KCTC 19936]
MASARWTHGPWHRARRGILALVLVGGLGACGTVPAPEAGESSSPPTTAGSTGTVASPTPSAPTPSATSTAAADGTSIIAADSQFGAVLFDASGQAIYVFDLETTAEPACYDDCAEAWPPVLTDGEPVAGTGARARLLGTTTRSDGSVQVTYNDRPLYFYAHEGKNEVRCHDIFLNGGNWYALQPDGEEAPKT